MKEDLKNDIKFKNVSNRIGHINYTLYDLHNKNIISTLI